MKPKIGRRSLSFSAEDRDAALARAGKNNINNRKKTNLDWGMKMLFTLNGAPTTHVSSHFFIK